jgi:hypothetical protein
MYFIYAKILDEEGNLLGIDYNKSPQLYDQEEIDSFDDDTLRNYLALPLTEAASIKRNRIPYIPNPSNKLN